MLDRREADTKLPPSDERRSGTDRRSQDPQTVGLRLAIKLNSDSSGKRERDGLGRFNDEPKESVDVTGAVVILSVIAIVAMAHSCGLV